MGSWHDAPASTLEAVLAALGAADDRHPDDRPPPAITVRLDHPLPPVPNGVLTLEDGATLRLSGSLPPDVPTGYHRLQPEDGPASQLIVSPGAMPLPASRAWGWAVQLYAARSRSSWGIGDLADLGRLVRWSKGLGARMALINPLHAASPGSTPEASPYFASSRCFTNPLYVRVEELPGAAELADLDRLVAAGHALNAGRRIDREQVWALKSAALERLHARFGGDADFDRYRAERGDALVRFATYCALAEHHEGPWSDWPADYRHPARAAVLKFAASAEGESRIRFYSWLQWHLDRQLANATQGIGLVQDLAIGVDAGGADAWAWQEAFAFDMRVGAPPDEYNTLGQDWGLPPWDPWRLRAGGYQPFVETVRAALRHCGGLRFDHVMGLFRLYWIPTGCSPADGTYVRYPHWDLLNILALEASRAGAYVVGEDLGTVEDQVRAELAERRVLSYRLWWFEPQRPSGWPTQALGAVTTHDLPTIAGVWSGSDLEMQRRLELAPNEEGSLSLRRRLVEWTETDEGAPVGEVIDATYAELAQAPCLLLTAALEDAAAVEERPNVPGTTGQWPNWSMALPLPLEELEQAPLAAAIANRLGARENP